MAWNDRIGIQPVRPDRTLQDALDGIIDSRIERDSEADQEQHNATRLWPRDWLSAGRLGWPLQWQVLHALGCPGAPVDAYARRKFLRGNQIEDWFVNTLTIPHERQKPCTYRETCGYIDALVTATYDAPYEQQKSVWEVKSVVGDKFTRLKKQGPDRPHCLQAACYALAEGAKAFTVIYVAADSLQVLPFTEATKDWEADVDFRISRFKEAMETYSPDGVTIKVPTFEAEQKWQIQGRYSRYPDWSKLNEDEIYAKVRKELAGWNHE